MSRSSGLLHPVVLPYYSNVSVNLSASIFRVKSLIVM
jgi:hypothetical protein